VVGFGPGSATDIVARLISEELRSEFNRPFVIDNRPGANGAIASELVARAEPDGYTLGLTTATVQAINPHLRKNLPYDPEKDFSAIALICSLPYLLVVSPDLPVKSVSEMIAWAGKSENNVSYGYANGPGQIAGWLLAARGGFHAAGVPYRSSPQAIKDVVAREIHYMFADTASAQPLLQSKNIRALAIASDRRSPLVSDIPTIEEAAGLKGFDLLTWIGLVGPAALPSEIPSRINAVLAKALSKREMVQRLADLGADVMTASVQEVRTFMAKELEVWGKRVREAGIEPT